MKGHENVNDSAFTDIPDSIDSSPRRSTQVLALREIFSSQIAYGSGPLLKSDSQDKASLSEHDQKSANYVSMQAAKSHQNMVRV